jgi:phosphatidylglycerol---prolipoprotein diacylglyceryl transferase
MKPILFSFGPVHLFSYGLMIASGVLLSIYLMRRENRLHPIAPGETISDLVFVTLAGGVAGSRLYYVLQNWDWYGAHPLHIFAIWEGGLIFYGGVLAAGIAAALFMRKKNIPVIQGLDFLAPYVALSQAFGRIGCFLNGCCSGKFCDLPWAVSFPSGPEHVHPVQLYESFYLFGLFFLLQRLKRSFGGIFALYLTAYAGGRFLIEYFREGNPAYAGFTYNQWISLAALVIGIIGWVLTRRPAKGT